ncbi:MAG: hypothetical protein L0Z53_03740 [Acidobacteriales bacterium]|nr:hypothetical protein [Terriglobales bacterium]
MSVLRDASLRPKQLDVLTNIPSAARDPYALVQSRLRDIVTKQHYYLERPRCLEALYSALMPMAYKKSLLLAIAIVVPLTLLLWLTFSSVLFIALYPGVMVQVAITAVQSSVKGALIGLVCGAVVNALLYSAVLFLLVRARRRLRN